MKIINAKAFINGEFVSTEVQFDQSGIIAIGNDLPDDEVIDAEGNYLYPGIIDCHNHGGWLRAFQYGEEDEFGTYEDRIRFLVEKLPEHGVTTVFPTLSGTNYERVARTVRELRKLRGKYEGARLDKPANICQALF